mgnify:FL=1|nr:MAG TPA: Major capsid protein [Microviridae sp.]
MSKKNIFLPEVKNKTSRSAFDLSRRVISSAKCGELLPCFVEDMLPGDHIKINPSLFTRLAPLNTSNFARINQYVNFYFVPYRLLYRDFNTFAVDRSDAAKQASSILSQHSVPRQLPHVHSDKLRDLLTNGAKSFKHDSWAVLNHNANNADTLTKLVKGTLNRFGINRFDNALKLLQYLGYYDIANLNLHLTSDDFHENAILLNLFPLLAYQKVYCDFYRFQQWESDQPNTYNVDYLSGSKSTLDIPIDSLFDRVTAANPQTGLDGSYTVFKSLDDSMFDLRYVNAIKDTLFGVVPSAQFGAASTVDAELSKSSLRDLSPFVTNFHLGNTAKSDTSGPGLFGTYDTPLGGKLSFLKNMTDSTDSNANLNIYDSAGNRLSYDLISSLSSSFTIASLRSAQALQKFREVSLSNNSDYKSQIEAHFGVKVSSLMSSLCDYLGGFSASADISTVTNTNITDGNVADFSAIGSMSNFKAKEIDFTCREHGVIIGVSYVLPLIDVQPIGYDVTCLRSEFEDFAIPEFDRLGNEEVDPRLFIGAAASSKSHLGYGPRYYDYKTKYDICLGDFNAMSGGTQPNFVVNFNAQGLISSEINPALAKVITENCKSDIFKSILTNTVDAYDFKVVPRFLNNIFNGSVGNGHDDFSWDQFYNVFGFRVTNTRNLSYDGMPY